MKLTDEDIRKITLEAINELGDAATPAAVRSVVEKTIEKLDDADASDGMRDSGRVIITSFGLNQPGIVASITTIIGNCGGDIIDLSQKLMKEFFTMMMIVDISNVSKSYKDFQEELLAEANKLGIKLYVQHEDIFRQMHRI